MPIPEHASVSVHDLKGNLIAMLVDAVLPTGSTHCVAWNCDAPYCVYLIRLSIPVWIFIHMRKPKQKQPPRAVSP